MVALLLWCLAFVAPAQDESPQPSQQIGSTPSENYDLGVERWRAGDFGSARALWLQALGGPEFSVDTSGEGAVDEPVSEDLDRAALLYNLGNAAWRTGRGLEAAGWYSACIRIAPRHADAWANLEFVRGQHELEPADRGDLGSTFHRLVSSLTLAESEWLLLAAGGLWALTALACGLRGGAALRWTARGAFAFVLMALLPWAYNLRSAGQDPMLVIAEAGAPIHSEPADETAVTGRIRAGDRVQRLDRFPGWVKVSSEGTEDGWVHGDAVFALRR